MTLKRAGMLVAVAVIVAGTGASVQAVDRPVVGHVSFGASLPQGSAGDSLDDGLALHGGATWFSAGRPNLGLRFDLGYDWWDIKRSVLDEIDTDPFPGIQPPDNGDASVWTGTVDVLWNSSGQGVIGFYAVGGVGIYYAQAEISDDVYGVYCDPWWGYCYGAEGNYGIADHSDWTWGLNAGGGVTFRLRSGAEIYLEAVYHWMDTDKASEFVPVSVGFRW